MEAQWLLAIFEHVEDAIFVKDASGRYELINPAGARMLGCGAPDDVVGRTDQEIFGDEAAREIAAIDQEILATGESRTYQRTRLVGGAERIFFTTKVAFRDARTGDPHLIGIGRDITERTQLERRLSTSERLATIGALYGGVAHEVNNPLAVVMGGLDLLTEQIDDSALDDETRQAMKENLQLSRRGVERIQTIVRDLAQLARPSREQAADVDIAQVLDSALHMAAGELRYRAEVVRDFGAVATIHGRPQLLSQMFLQLVMLAARSLPEGYAGDHRVELRTRQSDGHIDIDIATTGDGLARGTDDATLAVVRYALAKHGGTLQARSRDGGGSAVRITLPLAARSRPVTVPVAVAPTERTAGLRVMVVDDEPDLRALIHRLLGDGHDYVDAGSGDEAVAMLETDGEVDVIFCDLMMPAGTGVELYAWLQSHRPELADRTIFVTGGAFTERGRAFLEGTHQPVVEKPFTRGELRAALAAVSA